MNELHDTTDTTDPTDPFAGTGDDTGTGDDEASMERGTAAASRPLDLVSLLGGVAVLVLTVAFGSGAIESFPDAARIVWPAVLLAAGGGLLLSSLQRR